MADLTEPRKAWDDGLKALVSENPDAFVQWLLGEGQFKEKLPNTLKTWQLEVDALLKVGVEGEDILLHIEFQTYHDATMDERLLRYNVLLHGEYQLPVSSYVIYLLKDGVVATSPLVWNVLGREKLRFNFDSIELGDMTPADLLDIGQPGLLPLLPLTQGGTRREVTNLMIERLQSANAPGLLSIGGTLAAYMLGRKNPDDLEWLQRRLRDMHDILRESPYYQEILKEGLEEGLEKGRQEGLEEGRIQERYEHVQELRQTIINIVQGRFPRLLRFARKQISDVEDLAELRGLIVGLSLAESLEQARRSLEKVDEGED
jgi:predicted transposase/invertase (TIGR01784 family)